MAETPDPDPVGRPGTGRGVGAGIALIFMTQLVVVIGVFSAFSAAVACGDNGPDLPCHEGPGWGLPYAIALPAALGIAALVTRRRWAGAPFVCWCIAVVVVPVLIVIR